MALRVTLIQGGGHDRQMKLKPTRAAIKNESSNGLSNARGTTAMARTGQPDSATSQFFINVVDNGSLDKAKCSDGVGYCVFGRVIEGMNVVDKIRAVPTTQKSGHGDVPVDHLYLPLSEQYPTTMAAGYAWNGLPFADHWRLAGPIEVGFSAAYSVHPRSI